MFLITSPRLSNRISLDGVLCGLKRARIRFKNETTKPPLSCVLGRRTGDDWSGLACPFSDMPLTQPLCSPGSARPRRSPVVRKNPETPLAVAMVIHSNVQMQAAWLPFPVVDGTERYRSLWMRLSKVEAGETAGLENTQAAISQHSISVGGKQTDAPAKDVQDVPRLN